MANVRWMLNSDMPQVYEIELAAFKNNCWTEKDFTQALKRGIGHVAVDGSEVLGFTIYEPLKNKFELQTLAVKTSRNGTGRLLVDYLINKLQAGRRIAIEGMVRESNLPAQLFFKDLKFKAVKVKRDVYVDTDEAGYLMRYVLDGCTYVEEEEVLEESYYED